MSAIKHFSESKRADGVKGGSGRAAEGQDGVDGTNSPSDSLVRLNAQAAQASGDDIANKHELLLDLGRKALRPEPQLAKLILKAFVGGGEDGLVVLHAVASRSVEGFHEGERLHDVFKRPSKVPIVDDGAHAQAGPPFRDQPKLEGRKDKGGKKRERVTLSIPVVLDVRRPVVLPDLDAPIEALVEVMPHVDDDGRYAVIDEELPREIALKRIKVLELVV